MTELDRSLMALRLEVDKSVADDVHRLVHAALDERDATIDSRDAEIAALREEVAELQAKVTQEADYHDRVEGLLGAEVDRMAAVVEAARFVCLAGQDHYSATAARRGLHEALRALSGPAETPGDGVNVRRSYEMTASDIKARDQLRRVVKAAMDAYVMLAEQGNHNAVTQELRAALAAMLPDFMETRAETPEGTG